MSTRLDSFDGSGVHAGSHECDAPHDSLCIDLIRRGLWTETVGRRIYLYRDVGSTNAVLHGLAESGASEGTVVLAEEQSRGRARPGKIWFSPPGLNLYASVLFRPSIALRDVPVFSFIASLALSETIWAEGLAATIKWPNDILVEGKKVAGTLVECADKGERASAVIVGVGVNMNVGDEALESALWDEARDATSLREAAGRDIDRNAFAAGFLNRLGRWLAVYRERGAEAVLAAWRERDALAGHRVEVRLQGKAWKARVLGIDGEGRLEVEDANGHRHRLITGEIRVVD
jgi:BirA family biotin operon repressor/biotin-[acetyl-CoA-carboxylase] ligase